VVTTSTGPLIPRRRLGAAFRDLREGRGETLQQTAKAVMFSPSKLSRIENGLAGEPHPRDVRDLIAHFALDGTDQGAELEQLAEEGRTSGWWQVPEFQMPGRLNTFISYENAASRIEAYVPAVVPGILQTSEYASATIHRLVPRLSPTEVEHQVALRLRRQKEIRGREPRPSQLYVIPETVLHRVVGSKETMRDQLAHLVASYDDDLLDVHVIPFEAGLYEAVEVSSVTIFIFDDSALNIAALERVSYIEFLDRGDAVQKYRAAIDSLSQYWLGRSESKAFIERLRRSE
jgi:transcriptional regulator with XRE-family HTH domain